jgi:hypothetical protein
VQSDVQFWKPEKSLKQLFDEKITSFSDAHPLKPEDPIILTDEGISIRQSDVDVRKPEMSLKWLFDENIISFSDVHS